MILGPGHQAETGVEAEHVKSMRLLLERRYRFSASHLYWRGGWTEERNRQVFGKCSFRPGHGHNYRLYLTVTGELDTATGFLIDLGALDSLVQTHILDVIDHRHLNAALPQFEEGGAIPTTENLVAWIALTLESVLPAGTSLRRLRLEEDEDLAAIWEVES